MNEHVVQSVLTHYMKLMYCQPLMTNTSSPSSASSSSSPPLLLLVFVLLTRSSVCHTLSPFFSWGRVRWVQDRGECELWWATDQNNWYFFIKTHVHPPTHKVTHACTVTLTQTEVPFYLRIPGERCSWMYFGGEIECVDIQCWKWTSMESEVGHEMLFMSSDILSFINCLDLKLEHNVQT